MTIYCGSSKIWKKTYVIFIEQKTRNHDFYQLPLSCKSRQCSALDLEMELRCPAIWKIQQGCLRQVPSGFKANRPFLRNVADNNSRKDKNIRRGGQSLPRLKTIAQLQDTKAQLGNSTSNNSNPSITNRENAICKQMCSTGKEGKSKHKKCEACLFVSIGVHQIHFTTQC